MKQVVLKVLSWVEKSAESLVFPLYKQESILLPGTHIVNCSAFTHTDKGWMARSMPQFPGPIIDDRYTIKTIKDI